MRGRKPTADRSGLSDRSQQPSRKPQALMVAGHPELEELRHPPDDLPEQAKPFWRSTVVKLVESGMIDRVDTATLEMLATHYARFRMARAVVAKQGMVAVGSQGQPVEHPMLKVERDATTIWLKLAEHYGLTTLARTRLGLAELHRRSLSTEMDEMLGDDDVVDADVLDDDFADLDDDVAEETMSPRG